MRSRKANWNRRLARAEVDQNISYQTLRATEGLDVAQYRTTMAANDNDASEAIVPCTNLPSESDKVCDSVPSHRDFALYKLQREVARLRESERTLLAKLTYAQEVLVNQRRFFECGLRHGQWETLGQLQRRLVGLSAAIESISDPNSNPQRITLPYEEQERLKRKL
jgi:hypothetical protein